MDKGLPLVLLTNYPSQTGQDLANRFATAGVDVPDSVFYTSAMATADFLRRREGKKAYVVGEGALIHELYKAGFTITDVNPDFVIVGETRSYNWDMMHKAAYFVANGASLYRHQPGHHSASARATIVSRPPPGPAIIPPRRPSAPITCAGPVQTNDSRRYLSLIPAFTRQSLKSTLFE